VGRVDLGARNELALGTGDAEVARDRLETVPGEIARRLIVASYRVEGVDQLAAGGDEAHASLLVVVSRKAAPRPASTQSGSADAAEVERDAKTLGASLEKGKVEAVEVVVLDDVRVGVADHGDELADQRRLAGVVRCRRLEQPRLAGRQSYGDE